MGVEGSNKFSDSQRTLQARYLSERLGRTVAPEDVGNADLEWRSQYLTRDFGFFVPPTEEGIKNAFAEVNRRYKEGSWWYRLKWNWRLRRHR